MKRELGISRFEFRVRGIGIGASASGGGFERSMTTWLLRLRGSECL